MPSASSLRPLALATVTGGLAWVTFAVAAILSPKGDEANVKVVLSGTSDYLGWGLFALCLGLSVAALLALHLHHRGADGRVGRAGALLAMAGAAGQCVVISTIVVTGVEPTWFNAVAPVAILTWVVGSVVFGVAIRRARVLPGWVGIVLPVATVFAIVGSDYGSSLLIGTFQLFAGLRIARAAAAGTGVRAAVGAAGARV